MRISWYFGFGWLSILSVVACGVGIRLSTGPVTWALYVPFLLVALYMTVRFRLFNAQPWRRVHARAMITYARLAEQEYDSAKTSSREFDVKAPCRALAADLLPGSGNEEIEALLGNGRKDYYRELVDAYPQVYLKGIGEDRHPAVLEVVRRDIEASELGPDIVIAKVVERKHDRREAANYLQALLLGRVR